MEKKFDIRDVHKINKYMYDNGINLPKSEKTLFISSVLLCLKVNPNFVDDYDEKTNSYIITEKMIKTIDEFYDDKTFTIQR